MNPRIAARIGASLALLAACFFLLPRMAWAGSVHGAVHNGTTGKLASGVEVILIELQGGMQPVQTVKTDAQGAFTFTHPSLGQRPMLLRAVYNGVNFHQPVPPGRDTVDIQIFDSTQDPHSISMPSHIVIFQPSAGTLTVGEEYSIQNRTQPPKAFFRAAGNFDFALPDKAELQQVAAWGPSGMPVVQAPIDHGNGKYSIAYAFHPGDSGVRLSYTLPYANNAASVRFPAGPPGSRLVLVAAPTVHLTAEGLQPAGQEQGMNIYRAPESVGTAFSVEVAGAAPPPDNSSNAAGAQEAGSAENIQVVPGRLDALKWPLIGGFAVVFVLAALILARKPVALAVSPDGAVVQGVDKGQALADRGFSRDVSAASSPGALAPEVPRGESSAANSASLTAVDAQVGASLDALKDRLFKLELRRQAGTIGESEYMEERARVEKVLRDLLKG